MDFFKGMSYDEICPIFQARFDANMRFLFKSIEEIEEEDQEVLKSINETPAHKAAKRRKLNDEAQEAEDLKKRLEVVDDEDDDVFIEATPLARKVLDKCSALVLRVEGLENANAAQQLEIVKLKARVKKLERLNKGRISVNIDKGVELVVDQEKDAEIEGRHVDTQAEVYNIDLDHSSKVLSMQEDTKVQKAVEVMTNVKLITEVVTAAATQVAAASTPIPAAKPKVLKIVAAPAGSTRKRKGVEVVEVMTTAKLITDVVTAAASQVSVASATIPAAKPMNPHIYISCIKQFWNTASVKRSDDVTRLQDLVDRKKIVISEDVIHEILQLDDAEGVVCLPNEEIFAGLAQMGYEKPSTKLTFYKAFFSNSSSKFYMYPWFIQLIIQNQVGDLSTHTTRFISPALTQKVFANMRRVRKGFSGAEIPLFEDMLAARQLAEEGIAEDQVQADDAGAEFPTYLFQQVLDTCSALTRHVKNLEHDKAAQKLEIIKLKAMVKRLERANKGRMINDLDKDEGIELVVDQVKDVDIAKTEGRHAAKQAEKLVEIYHFDLDHPSKVLNVVTAATSQDSAASATISVAKPSILAAALTVVAAYTRRRKGVIIRDPEKELSSKTPAETPKLKDKAKRRKLNDEAQEAEDHKNHLEVVDDEDDDVFTKATLLSRNVPIVDYQIVMINNKSRFKIIKEYETHQLYISFITLLKNFDREDLENLWEIAKERFSTSKPTNFSDEYLLTTLKIMFEKPDGQDVVWKSQRSVHGLALYMDTKSFN
nr:hypothetical protein [Tanacetum cinerariifolium]